MPQVGVDMRRVLLTILTGLMCLNCGSDPGELRQSAGGIHGGSDSNTPIVQITTQSGGYDRVVGNGTIVGPYHIVTASAVFDPQGGSASQPMLNWQLSGWERDDRLKPPVQYIVRSPRLVNGVWQWDGPVAMAVVADRTTLSPISLPSVEPNYPLLQDKQAYCAFEIDGVDIDGAIKKAPYCQVANAFFQTELFVSTITQYYLAINEVLPPGFGEVLQEQYLRYDQGSMFFVTYPSAFHAHQIVYSGSACPTDLGSPIVESLGEDVVDGPVHGNLVGIYLGDVQMPTELGLSPLPSCGENAVYSVAQGASLFEPGSPIPPTTFIRRAVANCTADVTVDECKARILCDESQGDYKLEGDFCRPSCGELADLRRDMLNDVLREQGKAPAAVPDSCALWCDNDNPVLPFWSPPIELGQSHDCKRCLYYPPGNQPYPSDPLICPPNPDEP